MFERPDFPDHLANLEKAAGIELGVAALHRLHMLGMGSPRLQRLLGRKPEQRYLLAVISLERLDRLKSRKIADDFIHSLAQAFVFVQGGAVAQFQVSDNNHLVDHSLSLE